MSPAQLQEIDDLAAPADDGDILIWPRESSLVELAERNHALRAGYEFNVAGRPVRELLSACDADKLIFMTGHQPEFFHAGVWAKNAAVSRLARLGDGAALFLVVDSDVPAHLGFDWPEETGPTCRVGSVTVALRSEWRSFEHLDNESPSGSPGAELAGAMAELRQKLDPARQTALGLFVDAFEQKLSSEKRQSSDYVERWMAAQRSVDASIGIGGLDFLAISRVFGFKTPCRETDWSWRRAAEAFFSHLAFQAGHFAQAYNASLARYRQRNRIHGQQHPIPDLHMEAERIEMPFWHVRKNGPRRRVFAEPGRGPEVKIFAEDELIGYAGLQPPVRDDVIVDIDPSPPEGLRPRALAQTMFARLFACDLFVHGIGGAKYDTITDDIIREFFRVEPPAFACVTATLRLDSRRQGVTSRQLSAARRAARDVRYNPQRYLGATELTPSIAKLLESRSSVIALSDQLHREQSNDRRRRHEIYREIRAANEMLLNEMPGLVHRLSEEFAELDQRYANEKIAGSREWFFALHKMPKLLKLATSIGQALSDRTRK